MEMFFQKWQFVLVRCLFFSFSIWAQSEKSSIVHCNKPEVDNGEFYPEGKTEFVPGEESKLSCSYNYTLVGDTDRLTCQEDGSWSVNPPYCKARTCQIPPHIMNGSMELDGSNDLDAPAPLYSTLTFHCYDHFVLVGPPELECEIDGEWIPDTMPRCEEVRCPNLPVMPGLKPFKQPQLDETVEFKCKEDYTLIGKTSIHCGTNGSWLPNTMPYCEKMRCPKLPEMKGLKIDKHPSVGGKLKLSCGDGFELKGDPVIHCGRNRAWDPNVLPHCEVSGESASTCSTQTGLLVAFCITTAALSVILVIICWRHDRHVNKVFNLGT